MKKMLKEAEKRTLLEARETKSKERYTKLKASKIIAKLDKSNRMLKRLRRKIKSRGQMDLLNSIKKILNDDQIEILCWPSERCDSWPSKRCNKCSDTLKKAVRLKLSCGSSGYKEILRQGFPLPSERTLRRRLEVMDFQPGISEQMFDLLNEEVSLFINDREKDC